MKKKLFALMMVLMLLVVTPVYADSFFPAIPETKTVYAPSYAKLMGVSPISESVEGNDLYQGYDNVTQDKFYQFGNYLERKGYSVTDTVFEDNIMMVRVMKDKSCIVIGYQWETLNMAVVYLAGVTPEP